ncbi:hypothetical protein FH972_019823 [Carpinus fangiana]|uniref:Uncharacterized protein n=1 Tax=Carpinus fangiana TaxID=176857 RepID=A0A5N6RVP6_9ROSI|nr:hypothetical protein FH972_019823 [Carpinus fangiana]
MEDVSRKVLVRIYGVGVEVFFDRDDEIRTFEFISKHGQGPLLGGFQMGELKSSSMHGNWLRAAKSLASPEKLKPFAWILWKRTSLYWKRSFHRLITT